MAENLAAMLREPAEIRFAAELSALEAVDQAAKPPGWKLSPKAIRLFILGGEIPRSDNAASSAKPTKGKKATAASASSDSVRITKKFHGETAMIERAIVTLMSNRGLLLVGEPGTAKSMLSELLAAAVSGTSEWTIQGSAGTTEDQIRYSWNYALLLSEGPSLKALVPAPLYQGMKRGQIVRFEEITRCPPEIQDTLISVLSDKVLFVPELPEGSNVVHAVPGFNIIATSNTRDRGVHEMSAALKRRFNFETVPAISEKKQEIELVLTQTKQLLTTSGASVTLEHNVVDVLVTTFLDLRRGKTEEGAAVERPGATMSTAEAVAVSYAAALDACYFGEGTVTGEHLARQLVGTVLKDAPEDAKKVRQYFEVVVKTRGKRDEHWRSFYDGRGILGD